MKYVAVLAVFLSACSLSNYGTARHSDDSSQANTGLPMDPSTTKQNDPIRAIDFRNFTYDWFPPNYDPPPDGRKIVLKNGSMDLGYREGKEPWKFFLRDLKYGDLTDDNREEAVIVLQMMTSGTARPSLVFVYSLLENEPKRLWVYQTGDRWDYGYHDATVKGEQLLIETYKPSFVEYQGQKHDMSASEAYLRDYYKWNGNTLVKVNTDEIPVDPNDKNQWVVHNSKP